MTEIKTSPKVLHALQQATVRNLTRTELQNQKISFVMGMKSDTNRMTRAQVEDIIEQNQGKKVPA